MFKQTELDYERQICFRNLAKLNNGDIKKLRWNSSRLGAMGPIFRSYFTATDVGLGDVEGVGGIDGVGGVDGSGEAVGVGVRRVLVGSLNLLDHDLLAL